MAVCAVVSGGLDFSKTFPHDSEVFYFVLTVFFYFPWAFSYKLSMLSLKYYLILFHTSQKSTFNSKNRD